MLAETIGPAGGGVTSLSMINEGCFGTHMFCLHLLLGQFFYLFFISYQLKNDFQCPPMNAGK